MYMTHGEARARLRRYYRILELIQEFKLRSTDILIAVGQTHSTTTPEEVQAIRRLDLLASVRDVEEALAKLCEGDRRFCELRWRQEFSFRHIGRELYCGKSAACEMEKQVLDRFIAALGFIPQTDN